MQFLPLHVNSGYSFLRSGISVARIAALSMKEKLPYVSLTDYHSMAGFPELTHLCQGRDIKPIYGMDLEIEGSLFTLFIKDEEGYKNAMALDLLASQKKADLVALRSHSSGLILVLNCEYSRLEYLSADHQEELPSYLADLSRGIEDFRLGLPYAPEKEEFVEKIRSFVKKYPYPLLAFPFLRYEKEKDAIVLKIVQAIADNEKLSEKEASGKEYFLSQETAQSFFTEEELLEAARLAETASHFVFVKKRGGLLRFPTPNGESCEDYLRSLAYEGLKKKNPDYAQTYIDRLEYELSVINKMGYASYFLIVGDYVHFAKTHGISVGPGRGSGAGSLVSYCLDIVTPDPIKYDLLFERFLNPERRSMPDIDVDFCDVRRDQVVEYLQSKYGVERVSHIITMQTLGARGSIRDIGRVFDFDAREIERLCKSIKNPYLSLGDNYRQNEAFRRLVDSDPYYLSIVSLAHKIEGLPRQAGLHAAGIVLNDVPLQTAIPTFDDGTGYVTQFEMNYLEEQGFLKMDLLGLRNLTIVDNCIEQIERTRGIHLNYLEIPYEDPEPIKMIASGKTMGLFQLESPGMNRAIRTVKPTTFSDIVAVIALFRPGPMENIPSFAARKAGRERITYLCKELEPILSSTYGIIVYQEQIMQIARVMAGFSYGEADLLRRAISKKNAEKLASMRDRFIEGCLAQGHERALGEKAFNLIYKFADYGFNKSHSLAYGLLACQMAYLKYHYPEEFYCAILDNTNPASEKFSPIVSEIKRSRILFGVPSINKAGYRFLVEEGRILFPLSAIKGVQGNLINGLIDERNEKGPFTDIFDFAVRMKKYGLNTQTLVKFVDAGCFDEFNPNRASLRLTASSAIKYAEMVVGDSGVETLLALSFPKPAYASIEPSHLEDLLSERDTLGMMISGSPLDAKAEVIEQRRLSRLSDLEEAEGKLDCAAIVKSVKTIVTKKGTKMAFITLYDDVVEAEFTMFDEGYSASYPSLKEGNLVHVLASKDHFRDGNYIADIIEVI